MIRLFVIEDHDAIIVAGLKRFFYGSRDGIEVTGHAKSVDEALASADPGNFDIFLLDLWLENRLPVDNIRALHRRFPSKPVIIYTSETSLVWKGKMQDEGASAYLEKSAARTEIKETIEVVAKGGNCYPHVMQIRASEMIPESPGRSQSLTPMQQAIIQMLARGFNHKEIARTIAISPSMLEKLLKSMRKQFSVKNNLELLAVLQASGPRE